jgi:hypothetical protein
LSIIIVDKGGPYEKDPEVLSLCEILSVPAANPHEFAGE